MRTETTVRPCLRLAALSAGVVLCLFALASPALPASVGIGFRVGPGLASCTGLDTMPSEGGPVDFQFEKTYRTGIILGGYLSFPIGQNLLIQPEVLYSTEGCGRDFGYGFSFEREQVNYEVQDDIGCTIKLNYLEIPLLAKYIFGDPSKPAPFVVFGPALGVRVGSPRITYDITETTTITEAGEDPLVIVQNLWLVSRIKDSVKSTNLMIVAGAGYQFKVRQVTVLAEARYTLGVTELISDPGIPVILLPTGGTRDGVPYLDSSKTSMISVSVGVTLPLVAD
ncbi:MAG: porin family protein [bacterium]